MRSPAVRATGLLGLGALALCCLGATPARAQPSAEVVLVGDTLGLAETVTELAGEIGVEVAVARLEAIELRTILMAPAPREAGLLARAWIEVGGSETLVVFSDAGGDHLLIRRVPTGASLDSVEVESLAQIITGSLEALKLGGRIGVRRAEVERSLALPERATEADVADPATSRGEAPPVLTPPAPPPTAPPEGSPVALDVQVGETVSLWSTSERPLHRLSVRARASSRAVGRPGLDLEVGYLVPAVVDGPEVSARLEGIAWRLGASARWRRGRGAFRLRVAAGLDLLHARARVRAGSSLVADSADWRAVGMLELSTGAGYVASRRLTLFIDAGVAFDLTHVEYLIEAADGQRALFSPLRVRPFLSLGLQIALDGAAAGQPPT